MLEVSEFGGCEAPAWEVTASEVTADGARVLWAQTPDGQVVRCGSCGARARSKGRRLVRLRDVPDAEGRPCEVRWDKRIWWCPQESCDARTWTEQCELAAPRQVLTRRARQWAAERVGGAESSVASAARRLGVGWGTVWSCVLDAAVRAAANLSRAGPVRRLGLDETVMRKATRLRRRRYVSAAADAAAGQIVDVFDGRDAADLREWLDSRPAEWRRQIETICVDPHEGCRSAVKAARKQGDLASGTKIAADPFHIVRLANRALDDARRRTQTDTLGHRGRKHDPLHRIRKLLLRGAERLDAAGRERMIAGLAAGDPLDEIAECWVAKEHVRDIFRSPNPDTAQARLQETLDWCEHPHAAPELAKLARTLRRWETEIGAAARTGTSNGRTEAANARIKDIKRSGRGSRNFANYRHRILLAAARQPCQTQPVTRIRTRRPSSDT